MAQQSIIKNSIIQNSETQEKKTSKTNNHLDISMTAPHTTSVKKNPNKFIKDQSSQNTREQIMRNHGLEINTKISPKKNARDTEPESDDFLKKN